MSGWTRLTVLAATGRAEVVVPDDEPVAGLVAELAGLVGAGAGGRPLVAVTTTGVQLDGAGTLADQDVPQGAVLRLTPVDQSPPPPLVADVTDVVADTLTGRPDRWTTTWTGVVGAAVALVIGWTCGQTLHSAAGRLAGGGGAVVDVAVLVVALLVGAVLAGRTGRAAGAVVACAGGVGVLGAWMWSTSWTVPAVPVLIGAVCLAVAAVAASVGRVDAVTGAGAGVLLAGVWVGLGVTTMPPVVVAGVVAVVGVLLVGVLPGVAMSVSGLNRLDDTSTTGEPTTRATAARVAGLAHQSLTWASVAAAAVTAVAGCTLAGARGGWATTLALTVGVLLATRARFAPLVPARVALVGGSLAVGVAVARGVAVTFPAVVAAVAAVGVVLVVALVTRPPAAHVQARWRGVLDAVELVAVLIAVPVLLAVAGVWLDLLRAFR